MFPELVIEVKVKFIVHHFKKLLTALLIPGVLGEEKHEKKLNSGPLRGIEIVSRSFTC